MLSTVQLLNHFTVVGTVLLFVSCFYLHILPNTAPATTAVVELDIICPPVAHPAARPRVFFPACSNPRSASQTSWMETICLTNEASKLLQRMPFALSPSGISFWTDHLFCCNVPSTEGPFTISAHKEALSCLLTVLCWWLFEWRRMQLKSSLQMLTQRRGKLGLGNSV